MPRQKKAIRNISLEPVVELTEEANVVSVMVPPQSKNKKKRMILIGVAVVCAALIGWGLFQLISFINKMNTYESQEVAWRMQATQYINALIQYDQNEIQSSTKK